MAKLTVTIQDEEERRTGYYVIDCVDQPDIDVAECNSVETINLIRAVAERRRYERDFPTPPELSLESVSIVLEPGDFKGAANPLAINDLFFELDNLLAGCRLNFITARVLKDLELEQRSASSQCEHAWRNLHLDKMERFHLGVFELTRIEDLIVRLVYEYFGHNFIEADTSSSGWEKVLTWWAMMDSLRKRENGSRDLHSRLAVMPNAAYDQLMHTLRQYKTRTEVVKLIEYRNVRVHRVSPSVDYTDMSVSVPPPHESGIPGWLLNTRLPSEPDYLFLELYKDTIKVYTHLSNLLVQLKKTLQAEPA